MPELAKSGNLIKGCTMCRRLEQLLKRYNRGEIARVEWLDHLTLNRIQQCRAQVPVPVHPIMSASGQRCGMSVVLLDATRRQACQCHVMGSWHEALRVLASSHLSTARLRQRCCLGRLVLDP